MTRIIRILSYLIAILILSSGQLWSQAQAKSDVNRPAMAEAANGAVSLGTNSTSGANGMKGTPHDDAFIIGDNDVLAINVWKEPDVSRSLPVRSDGKISLPLAGEVQASGLTPKQLEQEIATKLTSYISEPEVTVIVQEIRSQRFNILGLVARPGTYAVGNPMTVLDAIALAGGFRDFAKQKSIYVLRQNVDGTQTRLPFNYKEVIHGKNPQQNVQLQAHDTIVVP